MSAIRTQADLQNEMAADFAWRKKELHALKTMVIANENTHNRDLFIRAAITLLYAHWEGFIKSIGGHYLEFVGRKQLKHEELRSNFLAVALSRLIRDLAAASKVQHCLEIVAFFREEASARSSFDWKAGVNTKSNLKSSVFHEIVMMLGLDYSRFSTKEKLLDEKLLKNRNRIAHGQFLLLQVKEYIDLHDEVIGMMQDFYNQIENSAFTDAYRKKP
jgi:hypothetical protein